jgi:excisionase family DNA binding protein
VVQAIDLLTSEEAQAFLGVSRATFWNLVRRHDVPRYRIPSKGRRVFFDREDLARLREPQRVRGQYEQTSN